MLKKWNELGKRASRGLVIVAMVMLLTSVVSAQSTPDRQPPNRQPPNRQPPDRQPPKGAAKGSQPGKSTSSKDSRPAPTGGTGGTEQSPAASKKSAPAAQNEAAPRARDAEPKIVAVVGAEQISRQDLAKECAARYGKEVLETIINKHLILQACKERNIVVTDQDVNDEVYRIADKFKLTEDKWLQLLSQERNISPQEYKREIIWPTLALRRIAHDQMEISEADLKKAFEAEYGPQVRVRLIAVRKLEKAQSLLKQVKADPNQFETIAKDSSEDASASVMGLVPPIRRHLGDPALEQAAFQLKKGEISKIIEVGRNLGPAGQQYVILKCEEQIEARLLGGAELQTAKNQLQERLRDQKLRSASSDIFAELQKAANVINVFNHPDLQKKHPGVAALINDQPISINELREECVIKHGATVLDGEINRRMIEQELRRRNKQVSEDDIYDEISRAADSYGFLKKDGTPDVDAWIREVTERDGATVDLYTRDVVWPSAALKKLVGGTAEVNAEDLQKAFEANYGERVEVLAIVLANQRSAQQVWEDARKNPSDAKFGDLATNFSVEPASRANAGKVPPIRRYGGQPLVEEHAFKLKPGELSPIISVGDKFIIMRCLGRTNPVIKEMDAEVERELTKDVSEKKLRIAMNKEFDRLKETTPFDNFLAGTSSAGKTGQRTSERGGKADRGNVERTSAIVEPRGKSSK